eukprot:CAMPEP_0117662110 /NCGR_PEP_ID=MMETSP0804-20121206/7885_1 /TAXON_ID=1074897 /ORGANISM="Tetraselmis astigmatica, Strain CCMP880" /LENGTH=245 /DNA_ID=CAMNT_0005469001 /DNA_START=250 /DNA_END=989 /DNA_ORIENTATION=+
MLRPPTPQTTSAGGQVLAALQKLLLPKEISNLQGLLEVHLLTGASVQGEEGVSIAGQPMAEPRALAQQARVPVPERPPGVSALRAPGKPCRIEIYAGGAVAPMYQRLLAMVAHRFGVPPSWPDLASFFHLECQDEPQSPLNVAHQAGHRPSLLGNVQEHVTYAHQAMRHSKVRPVVACVEQGAGGAKICCCFPSALQNCLDHRSDGRWQDGLITETAVEKECSKHPSHTPVQELICLANNKNPSQ